MGALAIAVVLGLISWYQHRRDAEAKDGARAGCLERLGSASTCEERFERHHRDCFVFNHHGGGRFSPRVFDKNGYLDCLVETPDAWLARRQREREQARREERKAP